MICFDKDMSSSFNNSKTDSMNYSSNNSLRSKLNEKNNISNESISDSDNNSIISVVIKTVPLKKIPSFPKEQEQGLKPRNSMKISSKQDRTSIKRELSKESARRFGIPRSEFRHNGSIIELHSRPNQNSAATAFTGNVHSCNLTPPTGNSDNELNTFSRSSSTYSGNISEHGSSVYDRNFQRPESHELHSRSGSMRLNEERPFNPYLEKMQRNRLSKVIEEPTTFSTSENRSSSNLQKEKSTTKEIQRGHSETRRYSRRALSYKPTYTYTKVNHQPKTIEKKISQRRRHSTNKSTTRAPSQLKRSNAIKRKVGWLSAHIKQFLRKLKARLYSGWRVIRHKNSVKFRSGKPRNQRGTVSNMYANSKFKETSLKSFDLLPTAQKDTLPEENSKLLAPYQITNDMNINIPQSTVQLTRDRTIVFNSHGEIQSNKSSVDNDNDTADEKKRKEKLSTILPLWDHYLKTAISKRIQMNIDLHNAELQRKNTGSTMAKQDFLSRYISPGTVSSMNLDTDSTDSTDSSDSEDSLSMHGHSSSFDQESISDVESIPSAVSIPTNKQEYNKMRMTYGRQKMAGGFLSLPPTRTNSNILSNQSKIVRSQTVLFSTAKDDKNERMKYPISYRTDFQNTNSKNEFSFEQMSHPLSYSRKAIL
ncbi:hypothetical protein BRETT_000955 [Brettanomyces bruxellensis]|uniref:Uncharacterized protein n=1 Tax=Dekkera bruxellensis TaxID=5007 RepID=A0A871R955_DEKBR|nr:uncharacterized protein BRETT_000955 [Brettanomyces bruxellensis]QOU21234.1 hypothetical protein BRETT_000955 [Brettanomyces bruxellensis]